MQVFLGKPAKSRLKVAVQRRVIAAHRGSGDHLEHRLLGAFTRRSDHRPGPCRFRDGAIDLFRSSIEQNRERTEVAKQRLGVDRRCRGIESS